MRYPHNFPQKHQVKLLNILRTLQKTNKKFETKKVFDITLKQVLKKMKHTAVPPLWHLRFILERNASEFTTSFRTNLQDILIKTQVRSWSGIVPLSVFTKGTGCPHHCIYCANENGVPKSYFSDEPSVMRALQYHFDPFKQVFGRLQMFYLSGHPIDKIELIIQGGTFSFYDKKYREWFVKRCFDAANTSIEDFIQKGSLHPLTSISLSKAQKINETTKQRIIGITIETRPDYINKEEIRFLRRLGVTRAEIGVQSTDNKILDKIERGHHVEESEMATILLRAAGFKITYHLMPGLPGSSPTKDLKMLSEVFANPSLKPDNIKFYPTAVVKFSPLEQWYREGKFKPYSEKELTKLIIIFKETIVPRWLRIQRLVRDLTVNDIIDNSFSSNLRQKISVKCLCIRCREIKNEEKAISLELKTSTYNVTNGTEYFLEFVDSKDSLYGLLRLFLPQQYSNITIQELKGAALIRELHIYGGALKLGKSDIKKVQHRGLGKALLLEAEKIAREKNYKKIAVISGIGVREYYRKLRYELKNTYMIKHFILPT